MGAEEAHSERATKEFGTGRNKLRDSAEECPEADDQGRHFVGIEQNVQRWMDVSLMWVSYKEGGARTHAEVDETRDKIYDKVDNSL